MLKDRDLERLELFEQSTWDTLIHSDEWQAFLVVVERHENFLNNRALLCIDKDDFQNAARYRARAKDMTQLISVMKERLAKFRKGGENGR